MLRFEYENILNAVRIKCVRFRYRNHRIGSYSRLAITILFYTPIKIRVHLSVRAFFDVNDKGNRCANLRLRS